MANINPSIFKAYDIRGIYPKDIDEEGLDRIVIAMHTFFKQKLNKSNFTVLLGRDMRLSSPSLYETAVKALTEMGADVIDAGLITTPSFYFAVWHYGYDAGIQITASHNPKEYAGIKFVVRGDIGLIKIGKSTGIDEVKNMALSSTQYIKSDIPGKVVQRTNILEDEVKFWKQELDKPEIGKFKVVADPANAMGGLYIEATFKEYPQDLIKINFELDGTFPVHQPDPLQPKNLEDLQKKIIEEKADIGLAPDGDGDRLMFIDERGIQVPPSIIISIVTRELLKKHPNETIVVDIRYLMNAQKIINENSGKFADVRVGHAFITERLQHTGGIFAGENSGHHYWRVIGGCEGQIPVIMIVLKVMTDEKKKLSEIAEELRRAFESGEYNFRVTNAKEIMEKVKETYRDGKLSAVDCVEIDYPEWRFSIRTSNTEPLLRLNVESYKEELMKEKRDELIKLIESVAIKAEGEGH